MTKTYCANCNAETFGEYCAQCGEQRVTPELRSMRYIIGNIFADLTTLDSKVWKTTLTVLLRPGQLERDFAQGRRVDYMKPITLFFLFNVLFVMFSTTNDFYVSFYDQMILQPYSDFVKPYVLDYVKNQGIEVEKFREYYDQLVKALARSMIIVQVPFFSLFAYVIFFSKTYYAGDYFTFSLNAHGWLLMWTLILHIPFSFVNPVVTSHYPDFDLAKVFFPLVFIGFLAYLFLASKCMFALSWWQCVWRMPFLVYAFVISHQLFRFVQLLITTALVDV